VDDEGEGDNIEVKGDSDEGQSFDIAKTICEIYSQS
jgi:hypothetical protein